LPFVLSAQNGVTVTNLAMNAGTVTFDVSWNKNDPTMPALWSDTVWVFVDYNDAGVMKRLPLSAGATLTATSAPGVGKVIEESGNNKGVWVVGNARSAGTFSATVGAGFKPAPTGGACVYASNYPPVAEYTSATQLVFTGTPMYDIVLKETSGGNTYTAYSDGVYSIPEGSVFLSFTDKTGAPGIINCIPSATFNLLASASGFCAGGNGVTFSLSGTESGRNYRLYKNGTPEGDILAGTGAAATFTGTYTEGVYTARAVQEGLYCEVVMSGSHSIASNSAPTAPVIPKPDDKCLGGGDLVFTVTQYSGVVQWVSNGGGSVASNNLSVTFSSPTTGTKSVTARTAQTYTNAPTCYSTNVDRSATVHALPTVSSSTGDSRCGEGTVVLTATPSGGAVIDWYGAAAGGSSPLSNGTGTNSFTTPSINTSTTYYAQARTASAVGCLSTARTAVLATVYAKPSISAHPASTSTCLDGTVTLSVTASPVTAYQWKKDGTNVGGNTASYTTEALSANATYTVVMNNTLSACSTTSNGAAISVVTCCHAPGATDITFAEFNPCPGADYGSTYTLTDGRDQKTYTVKHMPDGRYWMMQDLKFGDKCDKTSFNGNTSTMASNINSTGNYYGDCRNTTVSGGGYYYNWAATMNNEGAKSGGTYSGCTGTDAAANACQGICPDGWHVPTKDEFPVLTSAMNTYWGCSVANCHTGAEYFNVVKASYVSSSNSINTSYYISITSSSASSSNIYECVSGVIGNGATKINGYTIRCTKNY
jgi:uncharacterized protein (TIGR02145 family)